MMNMKHVLGWCVVVLMAAASLCASSSDVADAVMRGNKDAVRSLLQRKADVNAPRVDGTTALHWAVRADGLETVDMLIRACSNASATNREGVMPLQLAALSGNAAILERLIKAGADVNFIVNNTPRARMRDGTPRIVFATASMRAAFSGDIEGQ